MPIKIIFNDVDECLSKNFPSDGKKLSVNNIKDISAYSNLINELNEVEFVLCTGRALYQLEGILERTKKIKWVITENGSIINNLETKSKYFDPYDIKQNEKCFLLFDKCHNFNQQVANTHDIMFKF